MRKFKNFEDFAKIFEEERDLFSDIEKEENDPESKDFDTKMEKVPENVGKGETVFHAGKWKSVKEIRPDAIAVEDDAGKVAMISNNEIKSRGVLMKIAPSQNH